MQRFLRGVVPLLVLLIARPSAASRDPLVHIQTDRPSYRLGETVWYKVHTSATRPVIVRLLGVDGEEVERKVFPAGEDRRLAGRFFLWEKLSGGVFLIEASIDDCPVHQIPLEVYDLTLPELDLSLFILGEMHYPGQSVTATFRALDLEGRPVRRARVEYLATFGDVRIRDKAGVTDADGRAVIRFRLPAEVRESGFLSVGLSSRRKAAAVARRMEVSASVGRVDAVPEGGTIVEGHAQRLGLLLRDRNGEPTGAEGRILDDTGRCVGGFRADPWGLATTVVPYDKGRSYEMAIDRPSGVAWRFPLPGPTGHPYALFVDRSRGSFQVEVRGDEKTAGQTLEVVLSLEGGRSIPNMVTLKKRRGGKGKDKNNDKNKVEDVALPRGHLAFNIPEKARGIGHILVRRRGRVFIGRPVFLGAESLVSVALEASKKKPLLPGKTAELEVRTTVGNRPVAAELTLSLFQGDSRGMPDLAVRSLLEPQLLEEFSIPGGFFSDGSEAREDGFLLVYAAFRYPPEGVATRNRPPEPDAYRLRPVDGDAAAAVSPSGAKASQQEKRTARGSGRTVVHGGRLERLLERAHFTRSARPLPSPHQVRLLVPEKTLLATPGLGRKSRVPPQKVNVPSTRVDSRRTLFWSDRVQTDSSGRASIRLKLNSLVSDLHWVAEGHSGARAVSGRGTLSTDAGFKLTSFQFPAHLQVGDVFDVMVAPKVCDGRRDPVHIAFRVPACFRPLLRTEIQYDPRKDARLHKFRFRVTAPADEGEVRLLARRGVYREEHVRRFQTRHREVELAFGESGKGRGLQSFSTPIPAEALPGSVRVHASVSPGSLGRLLDWLLRLLRVPSGCFEQFTSKNYTNLVVLDALLRHGEDPVLLERAYSLARRGFRRLLTHRDEASGGFAFFAGGKPTTRCTVVAVRHLALYEKIFDGLGRPELETALEWLQRHRQIPRLEALYLTLSLHEIGRSWKGSEELVGLEPQTLYEKALQACCLASWPGRLEGQRRELRQKMLARLLDDLRDTRGSEPKPTPATASLMGSRGGQLEVETLSLVALALDRAGRREEAEALVPLLVTLQDRYAGTQSTAMAIHAYAQLAAPIPPELLEVEFDASGAKAQRVAVLPVRVRPVRFESGVAVKPGDTADVSVRIETEEARPYHLGCSYRLEAPRSSRSAPYRLRQTITPSVPMGSEAKIQVWIEPVVKAVSSQVVARIGLPGGCRVGDEALSTLVLGSKPSFWDVSGGYLNLYWERGPVQPVRVEVPVRAEIAGHFIARPSLIYPYYESGKESYAPSLELKVLNTFGSSVKLEDAIGPDGNPRRGRGVNRR